MEQTERKTNKWTVLMITVMCPFMSTLDTNIVNVALPAMADQLHVTSSMITWVASVYLIVLTASILFFGRLGDLKGQTKVFQYGMLLFTVGSVLCSVSPTFSFLIGARVIQALGASATMANSHGIITRTFPQSERGRALGINGAFVALGTLAGPALGGFIISFAAWEYMFWINVPIGVFVFLAGFRLFPKLPVHSGEKLDIPGTVLFAVSMVSFFFALQQSQPMGFFHPLVISCFLLSAVSFFLFLFLQKRTEYPLLQLDIFRNKWFSVSIFCAFTSYMAISCYNIVMPFYLQDVLGMEPSAAGLTMTVYPLVITLIAPVSGYFSDKIGCEVPTLFGLIFTCAGLLLTSTLGESPVLPAMVLFIAVMGLGNGLFQSPNNSLVMSSVPQDRLGVGGSVNASVRSIGQAVGVVLSNALLYGGMSAKIGRHVTDYVPGRNDAFLFGMQAAYLTAAAVCLVGVLVTALRLRRRQEDQRESFV